MSYIIDLDARVAGIPCLVRVLRYEKTPGSFSHNAVSDVDYYGWSESEWELLDRRGRRAPWLDQKLKPTDIERIEADIARALS